MLLSNDRIGLNHSIYLPLVETIDVHSLNSKSELLEPGTDPWFYVLTVLTTVSTNENAAY